MKAATARRPDRAMNAAAVDAAGIQKSNMSHIRNTKINKIHEAWAVKNGYRPKLQASSAKLDRSCGLGYSGTITNGNARLAQLNASPSIPPGSRPIKDLYTKAVASPEVGTSSPEDLHAENTNRFGKVQAPSAKRQASSVKLQASSVKHSQKISE